jgi:hypothetical protein
MHDGATVHASTEEGPVTQRARIGAFVTALLLVTTIIGTYCATAAAEEDAWDIHGMSLGFGGIYVYDEASDSDIYYDWCGPRNTVMALSDEGLVPQYSIDKAPWVPFVESVTFTVAGDHGSLHTVFARYVDAGGDVVSAAGSMGLRLALDTTGPVTKAPYAVTVRRFGTAKFQFRVRDRGSRRDVVRIVVRRLNGERVTTYLVGPKRIDLDRLLTFEKRIALPAGRYRWFVRAIDKTGNAQVFVGRDTLVVK